MLDASTNAKQREGQVREPVISVIIPVYNVEQYLVKCIQSVQSNTFTDIEIICIDDGSTDQCGTILDTLASEDPRIHVIHQKNQGVAGARNAGVDAAKGEFVAFVDSDDFIHPRYFETLLNCMINRNADIVVCGCQKFSENESPVTSEYKKISYRRINDQEFFDHYYARHMIWARLYRKKDLDAIRFSPDVRMADDTLYNLRVVAAMSSPRVYETETVLYYYLMRASSIVHTGKAERMIDTGNWYLAHRNQFLSDTSGKWKWLLLMQVIKATLSYRHTVRYIRRKDEEVRNADHILQVAFGDLRKTKRLTILERIILSSTIWSSWLYRLFRIIQDPTMLKWEKDNKKRLIN